jgi:hypothetical protein
MRRFRQVGIQTYRDHQIELMDDRGAGWAITIHEPGTLDKVVLRNHMPNGLEILLSEAKRRIDRRLDGTPSGSESPPSPKGPLHFGRI